MIAHDKLLATSEAKAPFYTEELYDSLSECLLAVAMEISSIRVDGKDALKMNGYLEAQKNSEKFSKSYFKSVKIIRNRISKLAILPGN